MDKTPKTDELDEAIAAFVKTFARAEARRLGERASEQFLASFSRELSAEGEMERVLQALAMCLRSYAERQRVEPELETLLQDWWGRAACDELTRALATFARTASSRGAERERQKLRSALPKVIARRDQSDRHVVVTNRRSSHSIGRWSVLWVAVVSVASGFALGVTICGIEHHILPARRMLHTPLWLPPSSS